jgi:hypothetical protein
MKRMVALAVMFLFVLGCGLNFNNIPQDQWGQLAVKNAARGLGYAIANSKSTVDDAAVIEAYNLFKTGQVDPTQINSLLAKFNKDPANQLIILAGLDLLQAMGASITAGQVVDISKIPPELWSMVEIAYQQGYALGKVDKAKGVTRAIP